MPKYNVVKEVSCVIVILAAGNSSRLGEPKQLTTYQNQPLLLQQIDKALSISNHVICVIGSQSDVMTKLVATKNVTLVVNEHWAEGMASSLAAGVKAVPENIDEMMILLVDQWQLSAIDCQLLLNIKAEQIQKFSNQNAIIAASSSDGKLGPPVIFNRCYFNELKQLTGHQGAKSLLTLYKDNVIQVPLNSAFIDLDTPEQLEVMRNFERQIKY